MEKRKVEITSLKLKLGRTEATLTIEEAKKLKKALEEIFGKDVVTVEKHYPYPSYPIIIEREVPYWHYDRTVYCESTAQLEMQENSNMLCCTIK